MTDTLQKAQSVAAALRADADDRANSLAPGFRDFRADAMADLAELVLGLVIAQTPKGDQ